jgi:heme oxygenase
VSGIVSIVPLLLLLLFVFNVSIFTKLSLNIRALYGEMYLKRLKTERKHKKSKHPR